MPRFFLVILLFLFSGKVILSQDIAPQIWSNIGVAWNINDQYSWRNTATYSVLLSNDYPWDEFALSSIGVYKFHHFFEATFGVHTARTRQTQSLSSYEIRPFLGFRATTNSSKRWIISNATRFEVRQLIYSDVDRTLSFRFRNRTYAALAITKPSMESNINNLFVFGYFEAFLNLGQEVRERFFNLFKYKIGLAYKINEHWGVNLGLIYQDSRDNVLEPTNLPATFITNYVVEWGIVYTIGPKQKLKNEKPDQ